MFFKEKKDDARRLPDIVTTCLNIWDVFINITYVSKILLTVENNNFTITAFKTYESKICNNNGIKGRNRSLSIIHSKIIIHKGTRKNALFCHMDVGILARIIRKQIHR